MRLKADSDEHISLESYTRWVRSYGTEQALIATARVCSALELRDERVKKSVLGKHDVGLWQLAYFAKTLIVASNDYRAGTADDNDLYLACNYFNNIREPYPADADTPEGRREVLNNLIRISYTQFPYQTINHKADIPRALILFEELANSATGAEFNVDEEFRKITGLSVREFLLNGFAVWAYAGAGEIPTPIKTSVESLKETLSPEKQASFRALVSADYETFRETQAKQLTRAGFEKQQFNCLNTFPLIRTKRARAYICPVPLLLIRRVTRGIFHYLQEAHSGEGVRNKFTQFFGKHLFEPYVGMQLKTLPGVTELLPDQNIGSEKTCDWILVEKSGITLIECKTLGITFRSKAFAETEVIAEDLRKRIIKGVQALERTRKALNDGIAGLEHLRGKTTRNLIVVYDEIFMFNSPLYRELLDADLKAIGLEAVEFQVCSISELEYIIPNIEKNDLAKILDEKVANKEHASWDLGIHIGHMIKNGTLKTSGPNILLDAKFDEVFGAFK